MKSIKNLMLILALAVFVAPSAYADCDTDSAAVTYRCDRGDSSQFEQDLDERDWEALYDYINTKRTINVQEKACNLTISGDVRGEWRHSCEEIDRGRINYKKFPNTQEEADLLDAADKYPRFGKNKFKFEFNLRFDYVCDRAWAVAHLQFDNSGGVCNDHSYTKDPEGMHGSGSGCDIDLKKAYMGYNLCCDGCTRFDVEVGRRRLYQVFDSEVQFLSRFDGILLKYDSCCECLGDWYVHAAGFIVDYRSNHYAWLIEGGVYDICNTGVDAKYSFVDWRKKGKNAAGVKDPIGSRFMNSQFTVYYNFNPEFICMPAKAFAAVLWNHDEYRPKAEEGHSREPKANFAWYAGFSVGEVICEGDWAFTVQYQWVEARAIPDDDVSGIGNGNVRNYSFTACGQGNTNFKGWRLQALYAFTDNLSFDARAEWSRPIESNYFGGQYDHKYSQFRLAAIYAF